MGKLLINISSKNIAGFLLILVTLSGNAQTESPKSASKDKTQCTAIEAGRIIWQGTSGGVICRDINGYIINRFDTTNGMPDTNVISVAIDNEGNKWFGTQSGGVCEFTGTLWTTFNTANSGLAHNQVYSIAIDDQNVKWFGTAGGLCRFDGSNWTTHNSSNSALPANQVKSIAIDAQNTRWIGTPEGVAKHAGSNWELFNVGNSGLADNDISCIAIDAGGNKYFGTLHGGVSKLDENSTVWTTYDMNNSGLSDNTVRSVMTDDRGNVWFGTETGGVDKLDGSTWTNFNTSNSGMPFNLVESIATDIEGSGWFGTAGGVSKLKGNVWSTYSIENGGEEIILTSGNETLHVQIGGGILHLTRMNDPASPYAVYSYERASLDLITNIRAFITIKGGTCYPNVWMAGQFDIRTKMVTGFYIDNTNHYWHTATSSGDSVHFTKASGATGFSGKIDLTRYYKSQHSLAIQIDLLMLDYYPCNTPGSRQFSLYLYPKATAQEMAMTAYANASGSDNVLSTQGNCNACTKKGVPGFNVSTVTLLPSFSDQDYGYSSVGPDMDFSRYFHNPGNHGMFGNGWCFAYEQELLATKQMAQHQNSTGVTEFYFLRCDTCVPHTYNPMFSNKKKMVYYPAESRFEIYDPDTKLFTDLQLYDTYYDTLRFHLSRIRDRNGNMVTVTYNDNQKISAVTDASGRVTTFEYGIGDRCSKMTLPDGRDCSFQYNEFGQLTGVIDIYKNDVEFTYDFEGFIASMKVNEDTATFNYFTLNLNRYLTTVTNLDGNTTTYDPELMYQRERWNRITDPSGNSTVYEIDPLSGSTIASRDDETITKHEMVYDDNKMLIKYVLPSRDSSITVYDSLKRIRKIIDFRGGVSVLTYDSLDNITEFIDAEANSWKWTYDEHCRIIKAQTPAGKTETMTWYPNGLLHTRTYGSSQTYTYTYDTYGNIITVTYPTGGIESYTYDEQGLRCTGHTDPMGNHTSFESDALDRIITTTHPDGSAITVIYNCCAATGIIDENGNTSLIERDPLLRIKRFTNAEDFDYQYLLDGAGRMIEKIRPDGTRFKYAYNSLGRMAEETDPFNETALMEYDKNGLLSKIIDQSGNVSTFKRSKNGKLTTCEIGTDTVTYDHDGLEHIISVTNARRHTVNYEYTTDGFIQSRTSSDIGDQYTYDEANRLNNASNASADLSFEYNGRNAVTRLTYDGNRQYDFDYNLNNELVKTRYSDNSEALLNRDSRGRITSITLGADSIGFSFDAASNLMSIHRSNGINTLIRRNKIHNKTAMRLYNQTDTLMKWDYTRNELGYITREVRSGILCSDTVFMPADTGGIYQSGNQLTRWQNLTFDYDDDGNLITVNPGVFTAEYDNLNRLTEWTQDGGTVKARYFYNANGYVAKKQVQKGATTIIYDFYYDANDRVIEIVQEGKTDGWKFYYNDFSLVACKSGSAIYFYHHDHQGNTVALSDGLGNIVQTYAYDAWGKILKETGNIDQPFKYSGAWGVMHEYNHLYRMPFRFYDSFTGKFIQRDPAGFNDGFNLYKYAGNNPINRIDPLGLENGSERPDLDYYIYQRATDPAYDAAENVTALESLGAVCDLLGYFIPGAKAGQAAAEEKPAHEVGIEAGKKLTWGPNIPFYLADLYNRIFKAMQKDSPSLQRQYGDPNRPPSGGGRKSIYY